MCRGVIDALLAWRNDPVVELVLLDHAGERGLLRRRRHPRLAESGAGDGKLAREFFTAEYRMNELMFRYPKPIVVVMDGITMGGGVGISMPGRYRIATERTLWAMPEGDIGFFPDVGEGWYLPRLPGHVGTWLGLTGARLKAADSDGARHRHALRRKREAGRAEGATGVFGRHRSIPCWRRSRRRRAARRSTRCAR